MTLQDVSTLKKSQRTKICIMDSYIDLMATEDCYSISVKAIVEHSGIARGTFYQHFNNTEDLLSFIEENLLEKFPAFIPDGIRFDFSEVPTTDECQPTKWELEMFEYYKTFSKQFSALLGPHGDNSFYHRLHSCIRANVHNFIDYYAFPNDIYRSYFEAIIPDVFLSLAREHQQSPVPGVDGEDLASILSIYRVGVKFKKASIPDLKQWLEIDSK